MSKTLSCATSAKETVTTVSSLVSLPLFNEVTILHITRGTSPALRSIVVVPSLLTSKPMLFVAPETSPNML